MPESTMLLISDDPALTETVRGVCRTVEGLRLLTLPSIDAAYAYSSWDSVALVLIHLGKKGNTAEVARLLRMIAATRRPVATLVLSEQYDAEQALALLRLGVADYLGRPLDLGRLSYLVDVLTVRARHVSLAAASHAPAAPVAPATPSFLTPPVANSTPAELAFDDSGVENDRLMEQVRRVAPQDTTILLSGETGAGKTRLAHLIHELSPRRNEPFLVINCGALSASLIESEMFGHVRGSFTSADRDRVGKFAEVGRGTLFLDEIDTLPLNVQAKLLRVVEDRVFEAVGSNKSQPVRARLVAASNRALDQEVQEGRFRSDLFYRLNVVGFYLPPLRERRNVISPLAHKFVREFAQRNGRDIDAIAPDAIRLLEDYDWPGNIRELRNVIERAVALCPGRKIQSDDLPECVKNAPAWSVRPAPPSPAAGIRTAAAPVAQSTLAQIKREAELARITEALEKHSNNRLRAASELGISRMTLYKKLYKYGLMTGRMGHQVDTPDNSIT